MVHARAKRTPFGRLLVVQRVGDLGWPVAQAAESVGVSLATAYKWLRRFRSGGIESLNDSSSRPSHCRQPCPPARSIGSWGCGDVGAGARLPGGR
jgi:hypothetical protein